MDQLQGILRRELEVVGYALYGRVQPVGTEAQGQSISKQIKNIVKWGSNTALTVSVQDQSNVLY